MMTFLTLGICLLAGAFSPLWAQDTVVPVTASFTTPIPLAESPPLVMLPPAPTEEAFRQKAIAEAEKPDIRVVGSSIVLNHQEVLRFRATSGALPPEKRAELALKNIQQVLPQVSAKTWALQPTADESQEYAVMAATKELFRVCSKDVSSPTQTTQALAQTWLKQTQQALGVSPDIAPLPFVKPTDVFTQPAVAKIPNLLPPQHGMASWYGPGFHGRRCSDGSRFDMNGLTAAHRSLPFGTLVKVSYPPTGKSCVVKITDRGPFSHARLIDLSKGAAQAIGLISAGVGKVSIQVLK